MTNLKAWESGRGGGVIFEDCDQRVEFASDNAPCERFTRTRLDPARSGLYRSIKSSH